MNQSTLETIDRIGEIVVATLERLLHFGSRLLLFATFVAFCAVPFILVQDKSKLNFWYGTGAYGIYLIGVSQILAKLYKF